MNTELFLRFEENNAFGTGYPIDFSNLKPEEVLVNARDYLQSTQTLTRTLSSVKSTLILHDLKLAWIKLITSMFSEINNRPVCFATFDEVISWLKRVTISPTPTICN